MKSALVETHSGGARQPFPAAEFAVLGIGDDCAVFRPRGVPRGSAFHHGPALEDVHFRARDTPRRRRRAQGAGARVERYRGHGRRSRGSAWCRWPSRPGRIDAGSTDSIAGCCAWPRAINVRWPEETWRASPSSACDIVVCGAVPQRPGAAARRRPSRAMRHLCFGHAGRIGAGTRNAARARLGSGTCDPQPRIELGRFLREKLRATAAMDLSDGLSLDLHRLCLASGVAAEIEEPPRFRRRDPRASPARRRGLRTAIHAGPPNAEPPDRFGGLPLTRIGTMRKGRAGEVRLDGQPLEPLGYDHFRHP